MTNKGLAWCGKIMSLAPIENADLIEAADVVCGQGGRWAGVVRKGEFTEGQLVEVYVQDALLPRDNPRFAFMEKRDWRIRMVRLRGVPSECLIMPWEQDFPPVIGDNITDRVGVQKFEREVPMHLAGDIAGAWPSFIPKTDEPNFQSAPYLAEALRGHLCYATIKYDGSSGTAFWKDGELHVCSRNWELKDKPGTAAWELARKYDLARILSVYDDYAIQFEMLGPKIQKNPLGLKEPEIRVFNVWSFYLNDYLDLDGTRTFCTMTGLPMVDIVTEQDEFDLTNEELRKLAEQTYPNGRPAEGIVVRPVYRTRVLGERLSFKVINLLYREAK